MRAWWLSDSVRLASEMAAVERLAAEEGWFRLAEWRINEFRFSADGTITAHGGEYPVHLIYPDQFPLVPAWVEPQDSGAHWSVHQYGRGGPLCLELRPDNWTPDASGADVLRSAFSLLRAENPLGEGGHGGIMSVHHVGEVQSYDWEQQPVLVGAGCLQRIIDGTASDLRALRWMAEDGVWPVLLSDAADRDRPCHAPAFDLGSLRHELPVVRMDAYAPVPVPEDRARLAMALGADFGQVGGADALIVVAVGAGRATPYHSPDVESVYERKWIILRDDTGVRSGRTAAGKGRSAAVVGLGSVGSRLAEMLLRSGVHRLVLVDGDVMLPANIERHSLDWRDIGFRKANAVKRRLLHIVPGATIRAIAGNLNWQRSARTHAGHIEAVAECDIIVDATGDVPTGLMLGAVAAENGKPFVSTEVFEGGLGCLVARALPGRDPPYGAGRSSYGAYCEQMNVTPPPAGRGAYEVLTEEGEPLVADDAAVTIAAGHAARVVLDILDGRMDEDAAAWLLIGLRKGWLFRCHGDVIRLDVGRSGPPSLPSHDAEAMAFAIKLAKDAVCAVTSVP